jgi:hypothetical protein
MAGDSAHPIARLILEDRARLAINVLTRFAKPDDPTITYGVGHFNRNPQTVQHLQRWYGKFMESLALMRRITTEGGNEEVDRIRRDTFLNHLQEAKPSLLGPEGGRRLVWLGLKYEDTGDRTYEREGELSIQRTLERAVHVDDYCYFPWNNASPVPEGQMPVGWSATWHGWSLQGAVQFHRRTGTEASRELADKTARYLKDHAEVFNEKSEFLSRIPPPASMLHFHHNANAMEGLTEYAHMTGDPEYCEFALAGYRYARALGSPTVGFFPEYIGQLVPGLPFVTCEGCCVADMVQMALWLSLAGIDDCWDDVDRYVRNQWAHMQMTSTEWLEHMAATLPEMEIPKGHMLSRGADTAVGCFAGWATANDFWAGIGPGLMNCCTGNCTRALYHVWDNLLQRSDDGRVRVHLLMDRGSRWVDIRSDLPNHGRVEIRVKEACRTVEVRAPEWIGSATSRVFLSVNDEPIEVDWRGRYLVATDLVPGDVVSFQFPVSKRTERHRIGSSDYTLEICGNNVVGIEPEGQNIPFYRQDGEA